MWWRIYSGNGRQSRLEIGMILANGPTGSGCGWEPGDAQQGAVMTTDNREMYATQAAAFIWYAGVAASGTNTLRSIPEFKIGEPDARDVANITIIHEAARDDSSATTTSKTGRRHARRLRRPPLDLSLRNLSAVIRSGSKTASQQRRAAPRWNVYCRETTNPLPPGNFQSFELTVQGCGDCQVLPHPLHRSMQYSVA